MRGGCHATLFFCLVSLDIHRTPSKPHVPLYILSRSREHGTASLRQLQAALGRGGEG